MEPSTSQTEDTEVAMERLIGSLNSLQEGERAEHMLVAAGQRAVPYLREFLLHTNPRSIATPRCRAARALGTIKTKRPSANILARTNRPRMQCTLRGRRSPQYGGMRTNAMAVRSEL